MYGATHNPIRTCPFDESHRVLESRMTRHLLKCRRNHPDSTKRLCPFNTSHIVDDYNFQRHVSECPSSENTVAWAYTFDPPRKPLGLPVISCRPHGFSQTEDWSKLEYVKSYDPMKATENRKILRYLIRGGTKSEKKQFRLVERKRWARIEEEERHEAHRTAKTSMPQHNFSKKLIRELVTDSKLLQMMELLTIHESEVLTRVNFRGLYISEPDDKKNVQQVIEQMLVEKIKKMVLSCTK